MADARGFFQNMQMPNGFFRANHATGLKEIESVVNDIFGAHPIPPGNNKGVGNYVPDPTSPNIDQFCLIYTNFVNQTVRSLYPSPTGVLLDALNTNLDFFFIPVAESGCNQVFPYGRPPGK